METRRDDLGLAHDCAKPDAGEDEEVVALARLEQLAIVLVGIRGRPCSADKVMKRAENFATHKQGVP